MEDIGYVQFYEDNYMGMKTEEGEIIVPATYSFIAPFSDGCFQVTKNGKHGFVNLQGKEFVKLTDEVECYCDFSEGMAAFRKNDKWGYINKNGKVIIKEQFQSCENFHDSLAKVLGPEGNYGFIDKSGKVTIPYKFPFVSDFKNGYATYSDNKSEFIGMIDKNGKTILDTEFMFIDEVVNGEAVVQKQDGDDFKEGVFTIGKDIVWNSNLDYINEFNRCSKELSSAFKELIAMYNKKACPCAYPRFRKLVQWQNEDRCFDAELLFGSARENFDQTDEMQDPQGNYAGIWEFQCPKCKSEYRETWRQFKGDFEVTNIEIVKLKAKDIGKAISKDELIPIVLGFSGDDDIIGKYDKLYRYVEIKELLDYLKQQ